MECAWSLDVTSDIGIKTVAGGRGWGWGFCAVKYFKPVRTLIQNSRIISSYFNPYTANVENMVSS